ncbi:MAG: tRNA (cytidine(34)-2'-O)-methyltransferase [Methylococcaceae bacterium]|nr:MAG: tRNA (cytidine(34)-2'-O)-methyltransferase [Methylococcaceae bacterium]
MLHIVLYQPEIPPNTGNIIRLCANTGAGLHLIRPLGFELDDARLRRAGLDYREWASVKLHDSLDAFRRDSPPANLYALTTKGKRCYAEVTFQPGDAILLGPESRGLPMEILDSLPLDAKLRVPMQPGSRSLNMSNAAAVVVYEAWRQMGFVGQCR